MLHVSTATSQPPCLPFTSRPQSKTSHLIINDTRSINFTSNMKLRPGRCTTPNHHHQSLRSRRPRRRERPFHLASLLQTPSALASGRQRWASSSAASVTRAHLPSTRTRRGTRAPCRCPNRRADHGIRVVGCASDEVRWSGQTRQAKNCIYLSVCDLELPARH